MRKLILKNFQSPGDIVMLTAAVRDLHRCHPGEFLTDVRTSCPDLWHHNPHLTPLSEDDPDVQVLDCHYPLIHRSNQEPRHFLDGFVEYLNEQLGLRIRVTDFKGDLHIHESEKHWFRQIEALELEQSGLGYQHVPPGYRFPYGHTHKKQEEVYVILRGSGG